MSQMKNIILLGVIFFIFFSVSVFAQAARLRVENPTCYNVYFERRQKIDKNSNGTITLYTESGTVSSGFDIWYEIPLTGDVPLYVRGDHRTIRENQNSLTITEPKITENYGRYLVIKNNADNAITLRDGGEIIPLVEQRGIPSSENLIIRTDKREFSPGETAVFDLTRSYGSGDFYINDSGKNIPISIPQPLQRNYLYSFTFDGSTVTPTDSRPLHRAGENGWSRQIPEANAPLSPVAVDGEIHIFAPGEINLFRYVFDSSGKIKEQIHCGDSFEITFSALYKNNFFIAGYQIERALNIPVIRIQGMDGTLRSLLTPSTRNEYRSAFLNTAANNGNTWLVAGGADTGVNHVDAFAAYVRLVSDNGTALTAEWELGKADFDSAQNQSIKCGEIISAVYDSSQNRWLITGKNLEFDSMQKPVVGSYFAVIGNDGKIQKIDTSFKGMTFNKLLVDSKGNYYLAGEEQRGNETLAVIIKYSSEGERLWQLSNSPMANSYYQDFIFNNENNQIILGGTMKAADEKGNRGVPFIEALNVETGNLLWREELSSSEFHLTSLVTAIVPAPDYGFALTLCGIDRGYIDQPYIIARVNTQGKLLK
jgi:hypothetical protein